MAVNGDARTVQAVHKAVAILELLQERNGMGVTELSASPTYLPEIKRVIRSIRRSDAEELANAVIEAPSVTDAHQILESWLNAHDCNPMRMLSSGAAGA